MRKSRISSSKQDRLLELFVAGSTARSAAALVGVNTKTAAYYFQRLRELLAQRAEQEAHEVFESEVELDESYFGGTRKGKRGRGAAGKTIVFGIVKRNGKVYTQVIKQASQDEILPIIQRKVKPDSVVYTDRWRAYNKLNVAGFTHYRINHSKEFAKKKNHINGIENFWNQAKRHMRKFNGVPKANFELFLRECEWRFNHPKISDQISILKQIVKGNLK